MSYSDAGTAPAETVLQEVYAGEIRGAFGTIGRHGTGARNGWAARVRTLLAILGPGLIVMVGDNDAGAFGTYAQAGQNFGTALLWTLPLLVPVLYVNQEMVLRLGAVARAGHARLILERYGRFWGAFSVIDLFLLNALTIVTEFIGISLALGYLGISRPVGVVAAAVLIVAAAGTGSFRRFERFSMALVFGSLLLIPVLVSVHPPLAKVTHDLLVPHLPRGRMSDILLLIIAIVGTTVAPWQLFFQQSYVIDKRITARYVNYERLDLVLGIILVLVGAVAMVSLTAATFAGRPGFGAFQDAGAVAAGIGNYVGRAAGVCFAVALIDASIIGAMAVSLSTAYAIGDVLSLQLSLHRRPQEAKGFYLIYGALIALSAALVLTPGTPLGLLTNAVQALAGVLLPSATVFLLLLCNDAEVLGPWVNGPWLNLFTGLVIGLLLLLSIVLTAAVLFPGLGARGMTVMLVGGGALALILAIPPLVKALRTPRRRFPPAVRHAWRMPALSTLGRARMTPWTRIAMAALRGYLLIAGGLVLTRILMLAGLHI